MLASRTRGRFDVHFRSHGCGMPMAEFAESCKIELLISQSGLRLKRSGKEDDDPSFSSCSNRQIGMPHKRHDGQELDVKVPLSHVYILQREDSACSNPDSGEAFALLLQCRRASLRKSSREEILSPDMGFLHVASIFTPAYPRFLTKVRWRSCCACDKNFTGKLDHVLQRQWQGKLHNGAILSLLLRHTTEQNAGRLFLVSSSSDAQLLMTCFGVPATADTTAGGDLEVVERCTLRGSKSGGPIFSSGVAPHLDLLVTGHAERELGLWRLRDWTAVPGVALGGHTGWVRTLAVGNKVMISAACNFIKVWELPGTSDAMVTNPSMIKHLGDLQLFKGDVLVAAMDDDCIYAATADGVLHMWTISQVVENLSASSIHKRASVQAHEGRIISLVLLNGVVITAGHDGHIRVWCKFTLQMKAEATAAHEGSKVHALASTSTFLFSGGADKFVRLWDPETLAPIGHPVQAHAKGVRSLAAITSSSRSPFESIESQLRNLNSTVWLVSGDAQGEVVLWRFVTG